MELTYTTIIHSIRSKLGLSNNEYMLCDIVYHLSAGNHRKCTASKETLGGFIGISKQSIHQIINKMVDSGYIVRDPNGLETTDKWYESVISSESRKFTQTVKKVYSNGKESLHNNNSIRIDKLENSAKGSVLEDIEIVPLEDEQDKPKKKDVKLTREHQERMALIGFFKNESNKVHNYCPVIQVPVALKRLKEMYRYSNYNELHGMIEWFLNISDLYEKLGSDFLKCVNTSTYNSYKDYLRKKGI